MPQLAPVLTAVSAIATVGGTILSVAGAMEQGREEKARFEYQKKVNEQQADEAQAASQREAIARNREGRLLMSQQRAALAGSGGNLTDPSVIDLMDDTKEQVTLASQTDLYKGEQQARGYNDAAKVAGYDAGAAMRKARLNAMSNLFSGVSSMFDRFGQSSMKPKAGGSSVAMPYG
ncbi:hypothetical protein ACQKP1_15830 [Allorhizobium sp. NPDC080224]|uniref:hypothetical protein n=1 Tax=Allorhizobium sp. NPDC080224 TaxID=3390547 RepID=UPI003CFF0FDE